MVKVNELKGGEVLIYTGRTGDSVNWTLGKEYIVFRYEKGNMYIWTDTEDVYFISQHEEYVEAYFELKEEKEPVKGMTLVNDTKTYVRLRISPVMYSHARVNEPLLNFFLSFYDYADASSWRDSKEVFLQGWITSSNKRKLLDEISSFIGLEVEVW